VLDNAGAMTIRGNFVGGTGTSNGPFSLSLLAANSNWQWKATGSGSTPSTSNTFQLFDAQTSTIVLQTDNSSHNLSIPNGKLVLASSTITGSASATNITMPSSSGTVALQFAEVYGSVGTGGSLASLLTRGSTAPITITGGTTISFNSAGTFLVKSQILCTVNANTLGDLFWTNTGGTMTVAPGFGYNGAASASSITLAPSVMIVVSSTATLVLSSAVGTTAASGLFSVEQLA
jgi:hypothetical protein